MKYLWQLVPSAVKAIVGVIVFLVSIGWGAALTLKYFAYSEAQAAISPINVRVDGIDRRQDDLIKAMDSRMNSMDAKLNILIEKK